jgi:putative oxidoreductase
MSARRQELQLLLVRLCVGLAFFPQTIAKLFAGVEARAELSQRVAELGIPHALQLVVVAGVVELAVGLMLTLGCCTRTAAVVAALYLAASAYLLPAQYGILWMLICASFVISGGGRWSIDGWLKAAPIQKDLGAAASRRQRPDR